MVKSNWDALAPCVLKSSESFFLELILGKRNSIEKQVAKNYQNMMVLQPLENIPESHRKIVWPNEFQKKNNGREQN
jgi:hypothetical protein